MTDADPRQEVDTLRKRLRGNHPENDPQVPFEADRHHLLKMVGNMRLMQSEVGDHRQLKLLRHCRRMAILAEWPTVRDFKENGEAEEAGIEDEDDIEALLEERGFLGAALDYRTVAEAIVRWIHEEYTNEHTNQDYRTALRSFGRYRVKRNETTDSLAWIPTTTSNDFNPVPSERDLLKWEYDVEPMIDATHNARDKALFAVQFEAGLRGGELYDLRVGDIYDSEHTVGLHVDGKRGERTIHLVMSVPYLQQWLNEHPGGEEDYLWSKLSSSDRPSYNTFLGYFKNAADRADVSKEVTPTNYRKSNTRWLVLLGMSQARIEDRQGRKRGSEHTRRYLARFGEDSNERTYARLHRKDVEVEEPDEMGPIECPRCDRETPRNRDRCMWCHFALSHDAAQEAEAKQKAALTAIAELSDEEDIGDAEAADALNSLIAERVQAALDEQRHS